MVYAGNKLFNQSNWVLFVLLAMAAIHVNKHPEDVLIEAVALLIIYIGFSFNSFYFETTATQLVVKSYMIPFPVFKYNLTDIENIQLLKAKFFTATVARLQIVLPNKKSIPYLGGSLQIADWQRLVDELQLLNIKVINTGVSELAEG